MKSSLSYLKTIVKKWKSEREYEKNHLYLKIFCLLWAMWWEVLNHGYMCLFIFLKSYLQEVNLDHLQNALPYKFYGLI